MRVNADRDIDTLRQFHATSSADIYSGPPERMRYLFRHLPEFMPHMPISRGAEIAAFPLPPVDHVAKVAGMAVPGAMSFDDLVRTSTSGIDGVVVIRGGAIIYEAYPAMRADDLHVLWSVTKAVLGLVVARLVDRGLIDVAQAIDRYIPVLAGGGWARICIRDILDMASGIDALEHSPGACSDPENPYFAFETSMGYLGPVEATQPVWDVVAALKCRIAPGTLVEYSSVNSFVLGWLVENVTGLPLADVISQEVWAPMGAQADAVLAISPHGAPAADGGISAVLRDVARFGWLFTPSGQRARKTVPEWLLREIQSGGRESIFRKGYGRRFLDDPDPPYCNSWHWDRVWPDGDFYKGGWGGQGVFVSPTADLAIAFVGCPDPVTGRNTLPSLCRMIAREAKGSTG